MASFAVPTFGFSNNNLQGFGSPKTYHAASIYQPIPAVGMPSFGGLGRPNTPKESNRHSTYSTKSDLEPTIQLTQPSVERTRRHREYYLEGGDIYFLVENYLFRVHRYFFERESPVFRKHFADSAVNGHHRVGASDNDPLVLHDVRTDDFSRFLWVFYNPIYSIYDTTTEDWAAILGLAHHWQFSEVKALVVRELEKQEIASIYKIVIYHRYNVDRGLLLPSYTDLVSREETLSLEEARDLGLETSLMIMTAREVVRKGGAPTSAVNVSPEELRNIIRQLFRFPGPRSDSPLSDITAAEPALEHRSPPLLAEKTDLPTVPEHENEPITITASASLNSPLPPSTKPSAPAPPIITPTPPTPAPSLSNKQASSKPTPATQMREYVNPAVDPSKVPKAKEEPAKPTPKQKDESKQKFQEPVQPVFEEPSKSGAQDNKKPFLSRLADASKGAGSPISTKDTTIPKDKNGDKPTENKEAKDAKGTADAKDVNGTPASGQDPNGTPGGTPLMNQDTDRPGTPSTGQSVTAKKAKTLLARAGEIKRKALQETDPSSSKGKGKEMPPQSLKVPPPTKIAATGGSEPKGPEPGAKGTGTKTNVSGKGKGKVAGDEGKGEGKSEEVAGVDIPKGSVKANSLKKGDVGQDTKEPGEGVVDSFGNVTPVTANDTTNPISDNVKVTPPAATSNKTNGPEVPSVVFDAIPDPDKPTTMADKKDEKTKEKPTKPGDGVKPSKEKAEPFVADEGDVATPRRVTKELPASPEKPLKEKPVPALGLTVPKSPKNGSAPLSSATVTGSGLSPLQKALEDAEDETLLERVARLKIGDTSYQPPKDVVPPACTDLESDSDCETAPSGPGTPRSRAGRGSFNLILRSDVPLSDDDDLFLDCHSNASVSNFDGI